MLKPRTVKGGGCGSSFVLRLSLASHCSAPALVCLILSRGPSQSSAPVPASRAAGSWPRRRGMVRDGRAAPVTGSRSARAAGAALTRAGLAQMFLQQRLLQQELKPAGLRRGAGPAGGGRLPVRRLRAHPAPAAATPWDVSRLQPDTRTRALGL